MQLPELTDIGFTPQEARTYLALLEHGELRTGKLCDVANIRSSHIYAVLERLKEKGVVSHRLANNTKLFRANDPSTLNAIYLKKQEELNEQRLKMQQVILALQALPKTQATKSEYKYFEGISGIKAMWLEIGERLIPNTSGVYYTGTTESWDVLNEFYLDYHKARAKKNVSLRMILPRGANALAVQRKKTGAFSARFAEITSEGEFGAYENFIIIQYTSKKETPRGFLISDPVFVHTFKAIFEQLWQHADEK